MSGCATVTRSPLSTITPATTAASSAAAGSATLAPSALSVCGTSIRPAAATTASAAAASALSAPASRRLKERASCGTDVSFDCRLAAHCNAQNGLPPDCSVTCLTCAGVNDSGNSRATCVASSGSSTSVWQTGSASTNSRQPTDGGGAFSASGSIAHSPRAASSTDTVSSPKPTHSECERVETRLVKPVRIIDSNKHR